jgi:DNA-binding transcriptional regulator YiaG
MTQAAPSSLVAALRAKLRLPRKTFARLTGFSERAIADWEKGEANSVGQARGGTASAGL